MGAILQIIEHVHGRPKTASLNTMTFSRDAAENLGGALNFLVIGHKVDAVVETVKRYGAHAVYIADDPALDMYTAEAWGHVAAEAARQCKAEVVCMNAGTTGRDLMPRVAGKLGAGMVSDVLGFDGRHYTRAMWAGNALATVAVTTKTAVATVQGTAFAAAEPAGGESPAIRVDVSLPALKSRFIEMRETRSHRPDLTEAKVVVSGGRGMKDAENFKMIEALADLFAGAVGASRAAVDAGWISNDFQVGQTGKTVAPDIYFAVGISGAIQHLAGMKDAGIIVAINKDEEAPIFEVADFGLVADLFKAVPELTAALKKELED